MLHAAAAQQRFVEQPGDLNNGVKKTAPENDESDRARQPRQGLKGLKAPRAAIGQARQVVPQDRQGQDRR